MPRTPAPPLESALDFTRVLWTIEHLLNRQSKLLHRRTGITGPQRLVMRIVQEQPGLSAGEIAELVRLDKSTLSGIFKRLETRRLLVRASADGDRRRAHFAPGPAARSLRLVHVPTLESTVQDVFAKAPAAQVRAARAIVRDICARLDVAIARAAGERGQAGGRERSGVSARRRKARS